MGFPGIVNVSHSKLVFVRKRCILPLPYNQAGLLPAWVRRNSFPSLNNLYILLRFHKPHTNFFKNNNYSWENSFASCKSCTWVNFTWNIQNYNVRAGGCSWLVECLPGMYAVLDSLSSTTKINFFKKIWFDSRSLPCIKPFNTEICY